MVRDSPPAPLESLYEQKFAMKRLMKVYEKKLAETHPQTKSDKGVEDWIISQSAQSEGDGAELPSFMPHRGDDNKIDAMVQQSLRKWDQLDVNRSNTLEGQEITELARWVCGSFRPGDAISIGECDEERASIVRECDLNNDGDIDSDEFQKYYRRTVVDMYRFVVHDVDRPPENERVLHKGSRRTELRVLHDLLDFKGDGKITLEELDLLGRTMDPDYSDKALAKTEQSMKVSNNTMQHQCRPCLELPIAATGDGHRRRWRHRKGRVCELLPAKIGESQR